MQGFSLGEKVFDEIWQAPEAHFGTLGLSDGIKGVWIWPPRSAFLSLRCMHPWQWQQDEWLF